MSQPWKAERRQRGTLPKDLSSWPFPNDSKRWTVYYYLQDSANRSIICQETYLQATLQAALARQDIDTLFLRNQCKYARPSPISKDLVTKLLEQDQDWKVIYLSGFPSDPHLDLEWLKLFRSVKYLTIRWDPLLACPYPVRPMIAFLRSMPNLKELEFRMQFNSRDFFLFCQDDCLAQKISQIGLWLWLPDDESSPSIPLLPNIVSLDLRWIGLTSHRVISQCLQQVSQWKSLQRLTVRATCTDHQTESFSMLADGIGGPLCHLRELEIDLRPPRDEPGHDLKSQQYKPEHLYLQRFLHVIGKNRSIRKLSLTSSEPNLVFMLSTLLPLLANHTNRIHYLGLLDFKVPRDFGEFLLHWQLQMRSFRLVRIGIKRNNKISYVSQVHGRWQKWQWHLQDTVATSAQQQDPPTPSLMGVDRAFWANELERIDRTDDPTLRCLSLDATYFLLQQWLSSISDVPSG